MTTSFRFSSSFEGREHKTDFGAIEKRLRASRAEMTEAIASGRRSRGGGLRGSGEVQRLPNGSYVRRCGTSLCLGSGFSFSRDGLTSQTHGTDYPSRFTTRVPVKTLKAAGGAMVHASDYSEEEKKEEEGGVDKFMASGRELERMKLVLRSEMKGLEEEEREVLRKRDEARKEVLSAKKKLVQITSSKRPLAMRDGQMFGDLSLRVPPTKVTPSATSDAMWAIMKCLDNRPETAPPKREPIVNANTTKSVEAPYKEWMNELGRY